MCTWLPVGIGDVTRHFARVILIKPAVRQCLLDIGSLHRIWFQERAQEVDGAWEDIGQTYPCYRPNTEALKTQGRWSTPSPSHGRHWSLPWISGCLKSKELKISVQEYTVKQEPVWVSPCPALPRTACVPISQPISKDKPKSCSISRLEGIKASKEKMVVLKVGF